MANVVPAASGPSGDYRDVYEALSGKSLRRCRSSGDCSSSRSYRARTPANGHDLQCRQARLSEPAPSRSVDGDLSPRGLALPLAVFARGANPMLGEDLRPVAWEFRRPPSLAGRSLRAGKSGDGFQRPYTQLGARGFSPIHLWLTGAARPVCAPRRLRAPRRQAKTLSIIIHACRILFDRACLADGAQDGHKGAGGVLGTGVFAYMRT